MQVVVVAHPRRACVDLTGRMNRCMGSLQNEAVTGRVRNSEDDRCRSVQTSIGADIHRCTQNAVGAKKGGIGVKKGATGVRGRGRDRCERSAHRVSVSGMVCLQQTPVRPQRAAFQFNLSRSRNAFKQLPLQRPIPRPTSQTHRPDVACRRAHVWSQQGKRERGGAHMLAPERMCGRSRGRGKEGGRHTCLPQSACLSSQQTPDALQGVKCGAHVWTQWGKAGETEGRGSPACRQAGLPRRRAPSRYQPIARCGWTTAALAGWTAQQRAQAFRALAAFRQFQDICANPKLSNKE
eukprot:366060-Chlamydomonas_euryale.AAC.4